MTENERLGAAADELLRWYAGNRRELPWRQDPTPYRVWISEIMLQQTRIEAVKGYFDRFLAALPDLRALAEAEEDVVLKLWEGLGYYSRARNLHRAAKLCTEQYGGELPGDYDALLALPGIGPYTAGAVGSIAFGLAVPAVDGNVLRVVTRILADAGCIGDTAVKNRLTQLLRDVMPAEAPGEFNEALMELGERICIPNGEPLCGSCPAAAYCLAHESGEEELYPVRPAKKARRVEQHTVLVISAGDRFAIRRRPEKGLLAGLYELPSLPGHVSRQEMAAWIAERTDKYELRELPPARHIFSHVEWEMTGWRISTPREWGGDWFFADAQEIRETYSLPAAFRAYREEIH